MIRKDKQELLKIAREILIAAGASEQNADTVAKNLVSANLSGVDTHGVLQLPRYVRDIQGSEIIPAANPEILKETSTSALVTGNWTFGQVSAEYAMEIGIKKAKQSNVAVVGLVQSHHLGRLGYYAEMASAQGMIAMIWGGGYYKDSPRSAPFGGREGVLDTNPIAMGFPTQEEPAVVFDYATTAVSAIKVQNARRRSEQLPEGCIIDKNGNPSTEPEDFYDGGAFLPFGGHKGYALMLASELLGRIFTGADSFADEKRGTKAFRNSGASFVVIKADLFQEYASFTERSEQMKHRIKAVPPAPGFEEVFVPGDLKTRTQFARNLSGIPLEESVWLDIVNTATALKLSIV